VSFGDNKEFEMERKKRVLKKEFEMERKKGNEMPAKKKTRDRSYLIKQQNK
jgi:hypothetical protein